MKKNIVKKVESYLKKNADRPIQDVYDEIRSKSFSSRSPEENLVYGFLTTNKKRLGIK